MTTLANDSTAELVRASGGRIRGTVSIPLCDSKFAVDELGRGMESLDLLGPRIFTSSLGMPLDDPRLEPFWAEVLLLEVPAWPHPERRGGQAAYPGEERS
jgi:predicted TIM-barrel fold metal-dependent hydrolase